MSTFPNEFMQRVRQQLPPAEATDFFHVLNSPPPVSIRSNPYKAEPSIHITDPVPWCHTGFYLQERPVFTLDPLFHAGCYYVQEAGSMLPEALLKPFLPQLKNPVILDACAAPGGKSTHLLSLFGPGAVLVSNEVVPGRNKTLRYNLAKWGAAHKIVTQAEPSKLAGAAARFDLIVADVPCSGEGLFRKDPAAMEEWSQEQARHCAHRQSQLLDELVTLLKEGGLLLYSTCTYHPSENDEQMERLLRKHPFEVVTPAPPEGIVPTTYGWQAWPHRTRSEGFYCSLLRYTGKTSTSQGAKRSSVTALPHRKFPLSDWLAAETSCTAFQVQDQLYLSDARTAAVMEQLQGIYLRSVGIPAGQLKGTDLVPSSDLALSTLLRADLPQIALDERGALEYLKCETIHASSARNGWHLMSYRQHPLGWAKKVGHRWNNYHPREFRILMDLHTPPYEL